MAETLLEQQCADPFCFLGKSVRLHVSFSIIPLKKEKNEKSENTTKPGRELPFLSRIAPTASGASYAGVYAALRSLPLLQLLIGLTVRIVEIVIGTQLGAYLYKEEGAAKRQA